MIATEDRWLKLKTACDKYDISYSQLFAAVKSGAFGPDDAMQTGRLWRIREAALLAWLRAS